MGLWSCFCYLHTHPSCRTARQDFYTEGASVPSGEWGIVSERCPTPFPQLLSVWEHVKKVKLSSVQFSSVAQLCPTLCDPMNSSTPGFPVHHQLPEFRLMSIESVMPSSHLILCHPLILPPNPPSIRVFSNESTLRMR